MRAGKTNSAHSIVKVIAMVKSSPMLAVPRWLESASAQNEPMVVNPLNSMAAPPAAATR